MKELNKHTFGDTPEHFKNRLAYALQEEGKPMMVKRKAYITIAVASILFIALACTALAVVFGNYDHVLEQEITEGYFDTWTTDMRLALVEQMVADGLIQEDARTERLFGNDMEDEARKQLATELVTEALDTREDLVSYVAIMETFRGPFEEWTLEDKAEYSELQKAYGSESSEAEFYMKPTAEDITQEDAIRIAREGIEAAHGLREGFLDQYSMRTEFYRMKQGSQEPRWLVEYTRKEITSETEKHPLFTAVVSAKGELIDDPERDILTPEHEVAWRIEYDALMARKDAEGENKPIFMWTLEEQAIVFPQSRGFPGADDVQMAQAIETANARVIAEGIYTEADLEGLEICPAYMTRWTDNVKVPFWQISYVRHDPNREDPFSQYWDEMLVFVDAKTGEVVWYRGIDDE